MLVRDPRSALDRRLVAVLRSNSSACHLALGKAQEAVEEARAAVTEDDTFEKGWTRLGAALEALNLRVEALAAYRRISTNELAAKRIAALEAPLVVVTAEGLSGVPEGSLNPARFARFEKVVRFYCSRVFMPGEPLLDIEPRARDHDYCLRMFLYLNAEKAERGVSPVNRHVFVQDSFPVDMMFFDVLGQFLALPNVVEAGCVRGTLLNTATIPALVVSPWTGEGLPPDTLKPHAATLVWKNLQPLRDMLLRNAKLVSEEAKKSYKVAPGFVLSILTHVEAREVDYSVHEGCCFPGCLVERAQYRCGKCFIARYCGQEHMSTHWREHKLTCVPLAKREPQVTSDCTECYLDMPEVAEALTIECMPLPRRTFPGVVVVKMQLLMNGLLKACDPYGVLSMGGTTEWYEEAIDLFRPHATTVGSAAYAYFDADMSVENEITVYMDRALKCTW
jgi:hypothetical protein